MTIRCHYCSIPIAITQGNVVIEDKFRCKKIYCIGGIMLLACLRCGAIMYDPAKVLKYEQQTQQTQQPNKGE